MVYLDYNATTPVDKRVLEAMMPFFCDEFANPASDHAKGLIAKKAVDQARSDIAAFIGAKSNEIIFTSGATEANNLALIGFVFKEKSKKRHIITSKIEHPAVLKPLEYLQSLGFRVTYLSVNNYGIVDLDELKSSITDQTALISIMAANNEIGTIEPLEEIGRIARGNNVFFHTDAAQAVGHIDINVDKMNIDLMSVSAHKFYGPKGIGCLFIRNRLPRVKLSPLFWGGGQERGVRSGTLNVPGIIGLAAACNLAKKDMKNNNKRFIYFTNMILNKLKEKRQDVRINGHPELRSPHTINIEIPGIDNKWLTLKLKDFCFSTGSACSSSHDEPSHVLLSIGLSKKRINNCIRIGVGSNTTEAEVDLFIESVLRII